MSEMVFPWREWSPWALPTYIALGTANHPLQHREKIARVTGVTQECCPSQVPHAIQSMAWITAGFHRRDSCSWQPSQHVAAFRGGDWHPSFPLVLPENGQYFVILSQIKETPLWSKGLCTILGKTSPEEKANSQDHQQFLLTHEDSVLNEIYLLHPPTKSFFCILEPGWEVQGACWCMPRLCVVGSLITQTVFFF